MTLWVIAIAAIFLYLAAQSVVRVNQTYEVPAPSLKDWSNFWLLLGLCCLVGGAGLATGQWAFPVWNFFWGWSTNRLYIGKRKYVDDDYSEGSVLNLNRFRTAFSLTGGLGVWGVGNLAILISVLTLSVIQSN